MKKINAKNKKQNKVNKIKQLDDFIFENDIKNDTLCATDHLDLEIIKKIIKLCYQYIDSNVMTFEDVTKDILKLNDEINDINNKKTIFSKLVVEILKQIITDNDFSKYLNNEPIEEIRYYFSSIVINYKWNFIESFILKQNFDISIISLNNKDTIIKSECYTKLMPQILDMLACDYRKFKIDNSIENINSKFKQNGTEYLIINRKRYNFSKWIIADQSMCNLYRHYIIDGLLNIKKYGYDINSYDDLINVFDEMYYYETNKKSLEFLYHGKKIYVANGLENIKCEIVKKLSNDEIDNLPKNVKDLFNKLKNDTSNKLYEKPKNFFL